VEDTGYRWEETSEGWLVVERGGQLATGPFYSKEKAREWFKDNLDIELDDANFVN
jgi:hypothetical protein